MFLIRNRKRNGLCCKRAGRRLRAGAHTDSEAQRLPDEVEAKLLLAKAEDQRLVETEVKSLVDKTKRLGGAEEHLW